jgi:hypothetical protein
LPKEFLPGGFISFCLGEPCRRHASILVQAYNYCMDQSKLVVVDRFFSQVEADLAKSELESASIDAMIQADTAGGMRDHLAWSGFGFKVLVREKDAADAHDVLNPPQNVSAEPAPPNDEDNAFSN